MDKCEDCPSLMVEYYRGRSAAGRLLERVLEHEFDTKHYRVEAGEVDVEVREGLKMLEQERGKFDKEGREERDREMEERSRVVEIQRKTMGGRG